jgi:hypothetical protein
MFTPGNFNSVWDRIAEDLEEQAFQLRNERLAPEDLLGVTRALGTHIRTIHLILDTIQNAQTESLRREAREQ